MDSKELIDNFEFLDDWEDKYRYIIDLGNDIKSLDSKHKTEEYKVEGCTSQVWIVPELAQDADGEVVLNFEADSDASIVKGLIAILIVLANGKKAKEVIDMDIEGFFVKLGLDSHLSPSRRNGLRSMVERLKNLSKAATAKVA